MSPVNKFRRDFLRLLAGGVLTTSAGIALPKVRGLSPHKAPNPLPFVNVSGLGPPQEPNMVEDTYCPLHKEKVIPNEALPLEQRNAAENLLKQELAKMGVAWQSSFTVIWTSQHYGVPDASPMCCKLMDYCIQSQDFLYGSINGLFNIKPTWSMLTQALCPTESGEAFQALVGRFTYLIIRVKALTANGEVPDPYLINIRPLERSLNFISASPTTFIPQKSTIYVIPGLTSLCSPFSELLHISTNQSSIRYGRQLAEHQDNMAAQEQAHLFSETVNEAMSITLAHQFLHARQYVNSLEQLSTLAQHMLEYLPDLDVALAYCQEQGVQDCFDSFQQDPGLLSREMRDYRNSGA